MRAFLCAAIKLQLVGICLQHCVRASETTHLSLQLYNNFRLARSIFLHYIPLCSREARGVNLEFAAAAPRTIYCDLYNCNVVIGNVSVIIVICKGDGGQ